MSNIWYTSDWHFCHDKDFIWKVRGFSSIDEMNEAIVERHNSIVKPNDIVYCLGDCIMGKAENGIKYLKALNGHLRIIFGNHDTPKKISQYIDNCTNIEWGSLSSKRDISKKLKFFLCHYPVIASNGNDTNKVISIHGHTHSEDKFEYTSQFLAYNVAMDAHNCYPVAEENILKDIKPFLDKI